MYYVVTQVHIPSDDRLNNKVLCLTKSQRVALNCLSDTIDWILEENVLPEDLVACETPDKKRAYLVSTINFILNGDNAYINTGYDEYYLFVNVLEG